MASSAARRDHDSLTNVLESAVEQTHYGEFESQSLAVNYGFSLPPPPDEEVQFVRTKLHEEAHLYQTIATSYGFYINALRQLQSDLCCGMIFALQGTDQLEPKFPLYRYLLRDHVAAKFWQVHDLARSWLLVEDVVLFFESDWSTWYEATRTQMKWLGTSSIILSDMLAKVEWMLAKYLQLVGVLSHYEPREFQADESVVAAYERQWTAYRAFTPAVADVRSVLEAGATAAEFWGADDIMLRPVHDRGKRRTTFDVRDQYSPWLAQVAQAIPDASPASWIRTVLALVDVSLCGPLLPHHVSARNARGMALELHPAWRMMQAVFSVAKIGPLNDVEEYSDFADAVCRLNEWPTLSDCNEAAAAVLIDPDTANPGRFGDLGWVFSKALNTRLAVPYAFFSGSFWDPPPLQSLSLRHWRYFQHAAIQFEGRLFVHKDRGYFTQRVVEYVRNCYLRKLFLGGNLVVDLPFNASDEDIAQLPGLVDETLLGLDVRVPSVKVRVAPRLVHRPSGLGGSSDPNSP